MKKSSSGKRREKKSVQKGWGCWVTVRLGCSEWVKDSKGKVKSFGLRAK